MTTELSVLPALHLVNNLESPLPLEHTAVRVIVTGLVASVTVSQRFRNPLTDKADLEYLFPLPHEAAVTAFELRMGERIIRASVQEIEQARQQFADARQRGQHASLLEGRRPNLFALQLANIQPGEFILAVTTYQQRLELSDGSCEFVFPMGLTPKYHRPGEESEASRVDAPLAFDMSQVGDVEISVEAETGLPSADPGSPTHPLIISRPSDTRFIASLDGAHLPNHDFVLRWRLAGETMHFPAWQTPGEHGFFLATFIPSAPDSAIPLLPREYVFVLDRSGSMSGEPILQAVNALRACLRTLNPQDTFAILLFDDYLEWLSPSTAISQTAVEQADALLGQVDGRGCTEILPALDAALSLPIDPQRSRLVVFLTDGAVSAEEQTLKRARAIMGSTRLFTFGVGPSVNRAFLQQLARIGRGEATFITLDDDIEEAILRFQDRIAFPLLTNLSLRAEGLRIWDVYPAQLPDIYADRPLEVVGRFARVSGDDLPASLIAQGERAGVSLEMRSSLTTIAPDPAVISRLWARARVDDLSEQTELGLKPEHATRAEIIPLAIEASLLTKYTAFLAVDSDSPITPGQAHFIRVAQPLPEGLDMDENDVTSIFSDSAMEMLDAYPSIVSSDDLPGSLNEDFIETENDEPPDASIRNFGTLQNKIERFIQSHSNNAPKFALPAAPAEPKATSFDAAAILRELARSQQLDGSWKNDVEITSAALLAFVRNGQTTQKGFYRKQLQRAFSWLAQTSADGFAGFLRALALRELANSTQKREHSAAYEQALAGLPAPADSLQKAALKILLGKPVTTHKPLKLVRNLGQLRLLVITRGSCSDVTPALLNTVLGKALVAGLIV